MNHLKVDLGQGALIKKNIAVFCVLAGGGVKCCDLKWWISNWCMCTSWCAQRCYMGYTEFFPILYTNFPVGNISWDIVLVYCDK